MSQDDLSHILVEQLAAARLGWGVNCGELGVRFEQLVIVAGRRASLADY
jgi:hypothetical protein